MSFYKSLFWLILVLFFVSVSWAEEGERIFYAKVTTGTYNLTENESFTIIVNHKLNKCYIDIYNSSLIIENGTCASINLLTFCVDDINESDVFNMTLFEWVYEATLRVLKRVPEIYIKRYVATTKLLLGEEITEKLYFGNKGKIDATDVNFKVSYPEKILKVTDAEGCRITENRAVWTGVLKPNEEESCSVKLKAIASGKSDAIATVEYYNGIEHKKVTNKKSFQVESKLVELAVELKDNLSVDAVRNYTVNLDTNGELRELNLKLIFPEGVSLLSYPETFSLVNKTYFYTEIPKHEQVFNFKLKFLYIGNFTIENIMNYTAQDISYGFSKQINFTVKGEKLITRVINPIIKDNRGEFEVANPTKNYFSSIVVRYFIGNESFVERFDRIDKMSHRTISFDYNGNQKKIEVPVILEFSTHNDQALVTRTKLNFTVIKQTTNRTEAKTENKSSSAGGTSGPNFTPKDKKKNIIILAGAIVLLAAIGWFLHSKQKL